MIRSSPHRSRSASLRECPARTGVAAAVLVAVLAVTACGSDEEGTDPAVSGTVATAASVATAGSETGSETGSEVGRGDGGARAREALPPVTEDLAWPAAATADDHYPVTVASCSDEVTFDAAPERAVVNDDNMIEMLFALGLSDRMAAYSAAKPRLRPIVFADAYGSVPSLGESYFELEPLLGTDPDFVFSGWNYGFSADGINPDGLAELGIASYVLSESCRRVDEALAPATIDDIYRDIRALGDIFGVPERAEALIRHWDERLDRVASRIPADAERVRTAGFLRGADAAIVAPGLTIVPELHRLAGASYVFEDVMAMWGPVSWEAFIDAAPELIVVTDYGGSATADRGEEKIALLLDDPALVDVPAVRDERFLIFPQEAVNPGIAFIGGVETLAAELYPEQFADLVGTPGFGLPATYDLDDG